MSENPTLVLYLDFGCLPELVVGPGAAGPLLHARPLLRVVLAYGLEPVQGVERGVLRREMTWIVLE